ncbi:hypothetical protein ACOMHN_050734 [Nucella lapillus]
MMRSLHDGMVARVIENGDVSDPFPVTNGVKQGCILAPTLLSLLFAEMLSAALDKTSTGITVRKERRIDPAATVACPLCGHICASALGLRSHRRRH